MVEITKYSDNKALFKKLFFEHELNTWILRPSNLLPSLHILFDSMDDEVISFFMGKELAMVTCQGIWAATVHPQNNLFLIIVFPNLLDLINSTKYRLGIAVLAHEMGHIFMEHSKRALSPMEEQFEADLFGARLGFGKELINFLSLYPDSNECKKRKERLIKEAKERHLIL
jgi:Peptidase family M48